MINKGILKRLWKYIKHSRVYFVISVILALITTALSLYVPILVGRAIDCMADTGRVDHVSLEVILIRIAVVIAITAVGQWLMNAINNRITYSVVCDIRNDAFKSIQKLPLSYLDSHSSGDITSRIITDADQVGEGLLMGFTQFFTGVVTILGTLYFMFRINILVAAAVVILTPMSLFVARFIAKKTYKMFKEQSEIRGEQTAYSEEMIREMKVVGAFSRGEDVACGFDQLNEKQRKSSLKAVFFSSTTNPSTRFVNNIVYAAVALIGAFLVCNSAGITMTVGQLASILSYANQYTKPFNEISGVFTELQNAIACAGRIFEFIDAEPESPDSGCAPIKVEGEVRLRGVSFSYTKDTTFIKDLDLFAKPGQHVAIVGHTGCGKTTLINLLMRFYDVDKGSISVDGQDIRNIPRAGLRRSFGMVLQDVWLKSGTVRDNITMGRDGVNDDEIIEAAKAARSWGFIRRLPDGLDTMLDTSVHLSAGQQQLLSITRIMLRPPSMLILDEATSSIDTRTEMEISKAFSALMSGRTSFVVAHRLQTIRSADLIIVMDDGKIVECGTHEELLGMNGLYAGLYNSQFRIF